MFRRPLNAFQRPLNASESTLNVSERWVSGTVSSHVGRDNDVPIELRQDAGVLDQDEISKGTGVGDDNHAVGR